MSTSASAKKRLQQLREMYASLDVPFTEDYDWGFYNGVEIALSFIENRPAFYVDKQGKHSDYDIKNYPEYFL